MSDPASSMALLRFEVAPAFDVLPDWNRVQADLGAALAGRLALSALLEERERNYAYQRRASAAAPPDVRVTIDNSASATSTLVEVRAPDRGPVLYQVTEALASSGVNITCALVNTLGAEAIDAFYVQTSGGTQVDQPADQARIVAAVSQALLSG
jgi:[protein-PII] uridylyltransferase